MRPMYVHEQAPMVPEILDSELCWELLQRVVQSPQLKRAARMREFLLFVGQRSLREGAEQIHEQEIGSVVFGRPEGYDTSADNIVRVNATDLRKRVDDYFATDGADEAVVMVIPRGSYRPVFRTRRLEAEPPGKVSAPEVQVSLPEQMATEIPPDARRFVAALMIVLVVLATACCVLAIQNLSLRRALAPSQNGSVVGKFWSEFLETRPNTDVILGDTTFSLIEDITKKPISLNAYLSRDYVSALQSPALSQDRRDDLHLIVQRSYGSVADFRVSQQILKLAPTEKAMRLYYARDYGPGEVKQDNVVLIGSRKSNPWVDLFASRLNFTVEYDVDKNISYVRNRSPRAGEQALYTAPPAPSPGTGYSVIAYLPNPDQPGKVMILAGTGGEATESAGEFLTSDSSLTGLMKLLHVLKLPYFEVLLKTVHLNGVPMESQIMAFRTYPDSSDN